MNGCSKNMIGIVGRLKFVDGSPAHPISGGFKYILNWIDKDKGYTNDLSVSLSKRWPHLSQKYNLWVLSKYQCVEAGDMNIIQVQSDLAVVNIVKDSVLSEAFVRKTLSKLVHKIVEDKGSLHFYKWNESSYLEKMVQDLFLNKGIHVFVYNLPQEEVGLQP